MQCYLYVTTIHKRDKMLLDLDFSLTFERRIEAIIKIVNIHKEIYRLDVKDENDIIIDTILYSYDKMNKKCPVEERQSLQRLVDTARRNSVRIKKKWWQCCC